MYDITLMPKLEKIEDKFGIYVIYFLVLICDLLVVDRCHIDFQRIFNYRPEHLVLVKPLFINRLYL